MQLNESHTRKSPHNALDSYLIHQNIFFLLNINQHQSINTDKEVGIEPEQTLAVRKRRNLMKHRQVGYIVPP